MGLVLGLVSAASAASDLCPVGYEAIHAGALQQCAHSDAAPQGERRRSAFQIGATDGLTCTGDGQNGRRLQALYVTERSPSLTAGDRSVIEAGISSVESIYRASSQVVSDAEIVPRWVHDSECQPSVEVVRVPTGTLSDFATTVRVLHQMGYSDSARKYIVWADTSVYCGIAAVNLDESKAANTNDGAEPGYARIDRPCWGYQGSVVAHEVTHTLGAVLPSAPHATRAGHCTDEYDLMCYSDGPGTAMQLVCPSTGSDMLLDCNNDDYFHPDPGPGNWLASHWNVADSTFLQRFDGGLLDESTGAGDESTAIAFEDVDAENPHREAINWLAERGVTRGCDAGHFCPGLVVTRGQMAAFLHRYSPDAALRESSGETFSDVSPNDSFAADIEWLARSGITRGCSADAFCPEVDVTRGQMAAFLYRAFGGGAALSATDEFLDVGASHSFATEISWLAATGVSRGCGERRFCPDEPVTREQMASFLYRVAGIAGS